MLEKMGGDNFPWVVLVVFSCLVSRDTESFGPSLTFHRCLYSTQHWKIEIVPLLGQSSRFFIAQDNKDNAFL